MGPWFGATTVCVCRVEVVDLCESSRQRLRGVLRVQELLVAHGAFPGGVDDLVQSLAWLGGVHGSVGGRERLAHPFQLHVHGDLPGVVEGDLAGVDAALELLDPEEVSAEAVERGVD